MTGVVLVPLLVITLMSPASARQNHESRAVKLVAESARSFTVLDRDTRVKWKCPPVARGVSVSLLDDGRTVELSGDPGNGLKFVDHGFPIGAKDEGLIAVPVREGLIIPSDCGKKFSRWFGTYDYEGCHMAMLGLVKRGSAVLVTWGDPYASPEIHSDGEELSVSFHLRESARRIRFTFLGRGGLTEICREYRRVAEERGLVQTWDQKTAREPSAAKLIGASNVKLWHVLNRNVSDRWGGPGESVNWTFPETAAIAEHLKRDLKIDRVLFMIGGWIRRGYDNQHPDILPAAPECGGSEALVDCARRVRALDYLFGLHDNYQDIYRDAPSWDEETIMKTRDGSLVQGGNWGGGQAWLTCAKMALELAKRRSLRP